MNGAARLLQQHCGELFTELLPCYETNPRLAVTLANVVHRELVSLETVAPIGALSVDTSARAAHCLVQALV